MPERIGFYICHCGINISYRVRVEEVADYVATLPNVTVSRDYLFMCSDPGQELIENDIRTHHLHAWLWHPALQGCMKKPFGLPASVPVSIRIKPSTW